MSFGIDTWSVGGDRSMSTLVLEADRALFKAKRLGRDRMEIASPLIESVRTASAPPHIVRLQASA